MVCPESKRPLASVTVPESITGSEHTAWAAATAALALRLSKTVSTISRSAPPSARVRACRLYASKRRSKVMLRTEGSATSGDREAVRPVGPKIPATQRGRSGVAYASAARRARATAAALIASERSAAAYSSRDISLALKVLVDMMSAPASRYRRWMSSTESGRVRHNRSLSPRIGPRP